MANTRAKEIHLSIGSIRSSNSVLPSLPPNSLSQLAEKQYLKLYLPQSAW